jgi:hypothetical protein
MPCLHVENLRYIGIAHLNMQLGNKQFLKTLYVPKSLNSIHLQLSIGFDGLYDIMNIRFLNAT